VHGLLPAKLLEKLRQGIRGIRVGRSEVVVLFREIGNIGGRRPAFARRYNLSGVTKPDEHAPEEEQSPFVELETELDIVRSREGAAMHDGIPEQPGSLFRRVVFRDLPAEVLPGGSDQVREVERRNPILRLTRLD
jgi:hypothetical protein